MEVFGASPAGCVAFVPHIQGLGDAPSCTPHSCDWVIPFVFGCTDKEVARIVDINNPIGKEVEKTLQMEKRRGR